MTRSRRERITLRALGLVAVAAMIAILILPWSIVHVRAAALLLEMGGSPGRIHFGSHTVVTEQTVLLSRDGRTFPARLYLPRTRERTRGIVLVHGVQHEGMNEPRLIAFARAIASSGRVVLTPQIASLAEYRLDESALGDLRTAIDALRMRPEIRRGGVGLIGTSFAGGLALRVASDAAAHGQLAFVVSIGGYHDLEAWMHDALAIPSSVRDPYAVAVFFNAFADRFVPAEQVDSFRAALRPMLLWNAAASRAACDALPPESRAVLRAILDDDRAQLDERARSVIATHRDLLASLSPAGHLASIDAIPVILVHGAYDPVVPPSETLAIAHELRGRDVRVLVTPLLDHVSAEGGASMWERWRAIHLLAGMLEL